MSAPRYARTHLPLRNGPGMNSPHPHSNPTTTTTTTTAPFGNPTGPAYNSDSDSDGQARGGRRALVNSKDGKVSQHQPGSHLPPPPSSANLAQPAGKDCLI